MRGSCFSHRRLWASHLVGAVAAAMLAAACLSIPGLYFCDRALATEQNIRDVPPSVGFMTGQVEQSEDGGATWTAPSRQFRLPSRALLRTGSDGSCVLVFEDRSLVAVKPGSTVQVLPPAPELRLSVLAGKVWVRFDYAVANSRNGIALPQATILAPGVGSFSFDVAEGASVVNVLEGSAEAASQDGGRRVTVNAGEFLKVDPGGPQAAIPFDANVEMAGWQPLLDQAGLSLSTTTLPGTTTTRPLPPDGPVGANLGGIVLLAIMAAGAVAVLGIVGTFIYLAVNRRDRRRRSGQ